MATGNAILDGLTPELSTLIMKRARMVSLPVRSILYQPQIEPSYVYFPTSGIASVLTITAEGMSVEVEVIGSEGMVGSLHILGPLSVQNQCLMQLPGSGVRVPMKALREIFFQSEELRARVLLFIQAQTLTLSQIAGCHRMHAAEQRLARWLLMVHDRVGGGSLRLTQEFLAEMLGTQRTTVTAVASELQKHGVLQYTRGEMKILDRTGLEQVSCGCYHVAKELLQSFHAYAKQGTAGMQ